MASGTFLAWEPWQLGYPDQAVQRSQTALRVSPKTKHLKDKLLCDKSNKAKVGIVG